MNEKLKNYISHIETLMKHVGENISEIDRTVEAINDISKMIIESVSNSLDSIKKTDQIIKLINDITARIKILGINTYRIRQSRTRQRIFGGSPGNRQAHRFQ